MLKYTMSLMLLLLIQGWLGSSLLARPDVGFPDTKSYLQTSYNEENGAELKFLINGDEIPDIKLPDKYYNLQELRNFANNFVFSSEQLKNDIILSLGDEGDQFGNSLATAINSDVFLKEFVRMLESFDASRN